MLNKGQEVNDKKQELRALLKKNRPYLRYLVSDKKADTVVSQMAQYILMTWFERKCTRCHKIKPEEEFSLIKDRGKIRRKSRCGSCERERAKEYYINNKQDIKFRATMRMLHTKGTGDVNTEPARIIRMRVG